MNIREEALRVHCELQGKLSIESKMKLNSKEDLSIAYTPGVAEPCKEIAADKEKVYNYTMKGNTVAVVTNGTAVLGLGNIGAEASLPVMEGKAILFKEFGGINAFPICINSQDPEDIIKTVKLIAPGFGEGGVLGVSSLPPPQETQNIDTIMTAKIPIVFFIFLSL